MIKIGHVSDTHGWNDYEFPEVDIMIHSGDATNLGRNEEWDRFFNKVSLLPEGIPYGFVPGNHDKPNEGTVSLPLGKLIDLSTENLTLNGITFGGYHLVPEMPLYSIRTAQRDFLLREGFKDGRWCNEANEKTRKQRLDELMYCDVLVSHAPPTGLKGGVFDRNGCDVCLRDYILQYKPKLVLCGHVHELNGEYMIGDTKVVVSFKEVRTITLD